MSRELRHPPSAACLSASLRDVGYSLEAAIADLIDNSISAGASVIDIVCDTSSSEPIVLILDNGRGMTASELLVAMRHGTDNLKKSRPSKDLGRFGLGLKTASFSQCRSLTVVSRQAQGLCGAEWNLDRIEAADDWILYVLDEAEIQTLPQISRLGARGTAVIWQILDRLTEDATGERRQEIVNEKLHSVSRHLSLVFHRFLAGEVKGNPKLGITVNGRKVVPFDPFCRTNAATQVLPNEVVRVRKSEVRLQPYVLPHHSRLSKSESELYKDRSDFTSNQGAYVYRNGRLMVWGDWFRLVPKGESTKLARVQIDFTNTLDEEWTIDIKKSRASPPHAVRERLRQLIDRITDRSISIHRGRGQKLFQAVQTPLWDRRADHEGTRFVINNEHPIIRSLSAKLSKSDALSLRVLLDAISASVPIEMIYSEYSTEPSAIKRNLADETTTLERLRQLRQVLYEDGPADTESFLQVIRSTRLFDEHTEAVHRFIVEELA